MAAMYPSLFDPIFNVYVGCISTTHPKILKALNIELVVNCLSDSEYNPQIQHVVPMSLAALSSQLASFSCGGAPPACQSPAEQAVPPAPMEAALPSQVLPVPGESPEPTLTATCPSPAAPLRIPCKSPFRIDPGAVLLQENIVFTSPSQPVEPTLECVQSPCESKPPSLPVSPVVVVPGDFKPAELSSTEVTYHEIELESTVEASIPPDPVAPIPGCVAPEFCVPGCIALDACAPASVAISAPLQPIASKSRRHLTLPVTKCVPKIERSRWCNVASLPHAEYSGKTVHLNMEDTLRQDLRAPLIHAFDEMRSAVQKKQNILIHCHAGKSRSVSVAISWIMYTRNVSFMKAHTLVRCKHSDTDPNFVFCLMMEKMEKEIRSGFGTPFPRCVPYEECDVFSQSSSSHQQVSTIRSPIVLTIKPRHKPSTQ